MSNVEKDNLFEEVVNEAAENPSVAHGDCSPVREAKETDCNVSDGREKIAGYDYWDEVRKQTDREYRKVRVKGFFRALVEIGGYVALGGVMLAAQLLELVPAWVAVPVYQVSWIWSAIRMDRFFRR